MEYYLAVKRNEVQIQAMTWVSLENMLSKTSQSQKTTHYNDSIYYRELLVTKWICGCHGWGGGENGHGGSFWGDGCIPL